MNFFLAICGIFIILIIYEYLIDRNNLKDNYTKLENGTNINNYIIQNNKINNQNYDYDSDEKELLKFKKWYKKSKRNIFDAYVKDANVGMKI